MQYGSPFAFLLKCRYLVFIVIDKNVIDMFNQFSSHHMQNVSPHSPLSFSFTFKDADKGILEKYVSTSWISCNLYKKLDASSYSYESNASASPLLKQTNKLSINPFCSSMEL